MISAILEVTSEIVSDISSEVSSSIVEASSEAVSSGTTLPSQIQPVADWIKKAWQWCNQPLPLVGISLVTIVIFLWRVFVSTGYGKKAIKKFQEVAEDTKTATNKTIEEMKAECEEYKTQLEALQAQVATAKEVLEKVCDNSRNKQVKELAEQLKQQSTETEKGDSESDSEKVDSEEVTENGGEAKESQEGIDGNPDEE